MSITRTWVRPFLLMVGACVFAGSAAADRPAAPARPAKYHVELRFRLNARYNQRLIQFAALDRFLRSLGFMPDPGSEASGEDPSENRLSGTITSSRARDLLSNAAVRSLLLVPAGYQLPEEATAPVGVSIELASGLPLQRQRALEDEVRGKLAALGFQEALGYDNRQHTRMVGWIARGMLDSLLNDLRWEPSGWFTPVVAVSDLPSPLREFSPILVSEVIPEAGAPPNLQTAPLSEGDFLWKVDPALRQGERNAEESKLRLEVILARVPIEGDLSWQAALQAAQPGIVVEGRIGPILSVLATRASALALAALPEVSGVRLPRPAPILLVDSSGSDQPSSDPTRALGLKPWHDRGYQGQGIRVAIVDGDFRGYQRFLGKGLPASTHLIDFTAQRSADMVPDPMIGPGAEIGHGTQCALALASAAPQADLMLVRVDPAAPYMVEDLARFVRGQPFRALAMRQRQADLREFAERLDIERQEVSRARQAFLDFFGHEPDMARRREAELREPEQMEKAIQEQRAALEEKITRLEADEQLYRRLQERFLSLESELRSLAGVQVVASTLVWNEGYALGGTGPLTRYLNNEPLCRTLWFQAGGDIAGQSWAGPFLDTDGNGVLEFAPPDTPLPAGRWTRELNFLGWTSFPATGSPDIPAGSHLRLSIQWREPHDPEFYRDAADPYRRPLAELNLVVLRQRDPTGTRFAADDMELVARSTGVPQRLTNEPTGAVYEQVLELKTREAGRYAVRVEGRMPAGIRPPGAATIPAIQRSWELWPRLFLTTNGISPSGGHAVFVDFAPKQGGFGMPADAGTIVTVGPATPTGQPQPYGTQGPPFGRALLPKPDVLAPDRIELAGLPAARAFGSSVAASYAAGWAATLLSAGESSATVNQVLFAQPGKFLHLPGGPPEVSSPGSRLLQPNRNR